MSDGVTVTVARVVWTLCPVCGRHYPDAIRDTVDGNPVPGTGLGHRACPGRAPNLAPGGR